MLTLAAALLLAPLGQPRLLSSDLDRLVGKDWRGTLTYRDYTSNKRTEIKSSLKVTKVEKQAYTWTFAFGYADEPDANQGSEVKLKNGGRFLDDEKVMSREELKGHVLRVVTEKDGKDNDKPAHLRYVYLIGDTRFSIQRLVRAEGDKEYAERHIYEWKVAPSNRS